MLRVGEYLIRRACRRLPEGLREERFEEWAAELSAILDDPEIRWPVRRRLRGLAFAADQARGVGRMRPAQTRLARWSSEYADSFRALAQSPTLLVAAATMCATWAAVGALFAWVQGFGLLGSVAATVGTPLAVLAGAGAGVTWLSPRRRSTTRRTKGDR